MARVEAEAEAESEGSSSYFEPDLGGVALERGHSPGSSSSSSSASSSSSSSRYISPPSASSSSSSEEDEEAELGAVLARREARAARKRKRKRAALRAGVGREEEEGSSSLSGGEAKVARGLSKADKAKERRRAKKRPLEMSSKVFVKSTTTRLDSKLRPVRAKARDPRFDSLASGTTDDNIWMSRYAHIREMQEREIHGLKARLDKISNPRKREDVLAKIRAIRNASRAFDQKKADAQRNIERRREERKLVAEGKNPYYLKAADARNLDLALKYKQLKASGKLSKYMKRKRKRNIDRDRRKMPFQ